MNQKAFDNAWPALAAVFAAKNITMEVPIDAFEPRNGEMLIFDTYKSRIFDSEGWKVKGWVDLQPNWQRDKARDLARKAITQKLKEIAS